MSNFLQCDADGCDHLEDCPDYGPQLIGKPCPKCGSSLLTQEDFDAYEPIRKMVKTLEAAGLVRSNVADGDAVVTLNEHAGKLKIEIAKHGEGNN